MNEKMNIFKQTHEFPTHCESLTKSKWAQFSERHQAWPHFDKEISVLEEYLLACRLFS